ncbi:hypothetical protein HS088_TW06G00115 [Tripterygium wilfordii]|uniref:Uncharacterized protein n=1 Tax=Tripterygium wilfordii TaxID=458696 RepID=A0A7J7DHV5_TRIWF|nr:uncharacterized protein LOC120000404 [Tripterygium wilfordii]KAF5745950.1 hypothetical protein HS088_TW06G00115 [Tripterygium wilfordii]
MVVPLGPGKFYGRGLPRPRFFTDVKLNPERVDPPTPVLDPLLSWAREAHWSMGGLSFNRLRLQGRIEGNVDKLRKEVEKRIKERSPPSKITIPAFSDLKSKKEALKRRVSADSPPPAPVAIKRRRRLALMDEDDDDSDREQELVEQENGEKGKRRTERFPVRKLGDDFDRVAKESGRGVGDAVMKVVEILNKENSEGHKLKRGRKGKIEGEEISSVSVSGTRTSARLAKRRSP